ncbi:DUF159-domain-containing protein [Saitoella complicata NRRL Y-17804]|uniref:DUF159-domain-containing protein n=1 Tax=Saitoella complicata (strain BCRC 22490 / CBS 7301 / JCM 7358 / NBRC 10748 / NRRL Y-17804) TaxID=698492 RepID=A0A0E9NJ15_SAICN|nr:DUF159-domain-containing protein [Saitoella complicata NRRL Y-17804]ODQ54942.1 DUF159-domain-containing protein [Saitoella complicata NRRL Y-17804]GAO49844.1 hypothetical protein G7K_3981-t2 [Saitoella complicata NRRL Y-17804]
MCGRFALELGAEELQEELRRMNLPPREFRRPETVRRGYNLAPNTNQPILRQLSPQNGDTLSSDPSTSSTASSPPLVLEAAKWGLIPFWTKSPPNYAQGLKTINARDDSITSDRSMWHAMRDRKRCVVFCRGYFEWLKKGEGKMGKVPYFMKRKDGGLVAMAGLWDRVRYEGSEDYIHSFTIITTHSSPSLSFLHDRMPVILPPSEIESWLDPTRAWDKELATLLRPNDEGLEWYPVRPDVGKVGNEGVELIKPVDEAKGSLMGFFGKGGEVGKEVKGAPPSDKDQHMKREVVKQERDEEILVGEKSNNGLSENNAPLPLPVTPAKKRRVSSTPEPPSTSKKIKTEMTPVPSSAKMTPKRSSAKQKANEEKKAEGSMPITAFFRKK